MRVVLILIVCMIPSALHARQRETLVRENYSFFLNRLIRNIESVHKDSIAYSIPLTRNEAVAFYKLDYSNQTSPGFRKLLERIQGLCMSDKQILSKYLYVSEFVDGYFAEDYFDAVEVMAGKKKSFFCSTIFELDQAKVLRLSEIREKYCK